MDIFKSLDREYNQGRPKLPTFTAFINTRLEREIKKNIILLALYPTLKLIAVDPETGIYIRDTKEDRVIEVKVEKTDPFQSMCRFHKSNTCDHVRFSLLSPAWIDTYQDPVNDESYGDDDAIRRLMTSRES
jgi:hypothetical protein